MTRLKFNVEISFEATIECVTKAISVYYNGYIYHILQIIPKEFLFIT